MDGHNVTCSHFLHVHKILSTGTVEMYLRQVQSSGMTHNCLEWIPDFVCKYHIKYVLECSECIVEPFIDLNFGKSFDMKPSVWRFNVKWSWQKFVAILSFSLWRSFCLFSFVCLMFCWLNFFHIEFLAFPHNTTISFLLSSKTSCRFVLMAN